MRISLLILSCLLLVTAARAQETNRQLFIKLTYASNQKDAQKAIETIEAISRVPATATVSYQAGRSVVLKPGFVAEAGSTFMASIESVDQSGLRLVVFPNPVERSTNISFDLPEAGTINLLVVDANGKIVGQLLENSRLEAGHHQVEWQAEQMSAGVYMTTLATDRQRIHSRIVKK